MQRCLRGGRLTCRMAADFDQPEGLTMTGSQSHDVSALAGALGRLPSGIFILTARAGGRASGMLASWVQQAGFEPPMVTVAIKADRYLGDWVRESGRFALSQVATGHKALIRHFARGFPPEADAFEGLGIGREAAGGPVLADALAWLDAEVFAHLDGGDHRVFLARVADGGVIDHDAEPMVHVRRNGMHY